MTKWIATDGKTVHYGHTSPRQVTTTGLPTFLTADSEADFLALLAPYSSQLPPEPLPDEKAPGVAYNGPSGPVSVWTDDQCVEWWGVSDTNTDAENSAALRTMRDALQAYDFERHWIIHFLPGKTYKYDDNRWFYNFRRITIDGSGGEYGKGGACLQCTATSPFGIDARVFFTNGPSFTTGDFLFRGGRQRRYMGQRFKSATAGSLKINIDDPQYEDLNQFWPGQKVFLSGMSLLDLGYAESFQFFEFNEVVYADQNTLYLKHPLQSTYNDKWVDRVLDPLCNNPFIGIAYMGKPRCLPLLNVAKTYGPLGSFPVFAKLRGLQIKDNPNFPTADMVGLEAEEVHFQDIDASQGVATFVPRYSKLTHYERCHIGGVVELDKQVIRFLGEDLIIENKQNKIHAIKSGIGVQYAEFKNCTVTGMLNATAIESLSYSSMEIKTDPIPKTGPHSRAVRTYNRRYGPKVFSSTGTKVIGPVEQIFGVTEPVLISAQAYSLDSDTNLVVPIATWNVGAPPFTSLLAGHTVLRDASSMTYGIVSDQVESPTGDVIIQVDWQTAPKQPVDLLWETVRPEDATLS